MKFLLVFLYRLKSILFDIKSVLELLSELVALIIIIYYDSVFSIIYEYSLSLMMDDDDDGRWMMMIMEKSKK